jgi:hypothetical protein
MLHIRTLSHGNVLVIRKDVRIDCEFRCFGTSPDFLSINLKNGCLVQSAPIILSPVWKLLHVDYKSDFAKAAGLRKKLTTGC